MITIHATIDSNFVMSKELFAPTGILERNRELFLARTRGDSFVMSEDAYKLFFDGVPPEGNKVFLVSEERFKKYERPGDRYVEAEGVTIAPGFQTAFPLASDGRKRVTVLGGPALLQEMIRRMTFKRLLLVKVDGTFTGDMVFPFPITHSFDLVVEDAYPADEKNPYNASYAIYWKS